MLPQEELASGADYLELITRLLHRVRLSDPIVGLWEAADLQWWWRRERPSDRSGQIFWLDDRRDPVAAVVFTDWGRTWACDLILTPDCSEATFRVVWQRALDRMAELELKTVEVIARDDDTRMLDALALAGFTATGYGGTTNWLEAKLRPPVAPLPSGFRLLSRDDTADRSHHMIARNGEHVAERLAECSLYQPSLDLMVQAPNGEVAAYGLFWADPVTGVGLVEPMRTEGPYERLGLGRHLFTAGLDRLADRGCVRLKVTFANDNPASRGLYLGAGFIPEYMDRTFRRGYS